MPSWNDLIADFGAQPDEQAKQQWMLTTMATALGSIADFRGRNVLIYGSAFLQKPMVPAPWVIVTHEDLNGFMSTLYGMDYSKGLCLLLHTPGGDPNAAGVCRRLPPLQVSGL